MIFVDPLAGGGGAARGCVVDTAGHGGGSIRQGLACWPTVGMFWVPDLHLRPMLLTREYMFRSPPSDPSDNYGNLPSVCL